MMQHGAKENDKKGVTECLADSQQRVQRDHNQKQEEEESEAEDSGMEGMREIERRDVIEGGRCITAITC